MNAEILFVGEAPGFEENRRALKYPPGVPFVGKTGDEVNRHYLPLAGFERRKVMFTNAIGCLPVSAEGKLDPKRKADVELLTTCAAHHLYPLIERMPRLRVIVPMGAFAIQAICPETRLELDHGFPVDTQWGIPAFPMYHPALGIHEPKRMLYIRTDWQRLRQYTSDRLRLPVDRWAGHEDYQEVTDASEIHDLDPALPLAGDTEFTKRYEPYCLTYSVGAGTGRLIRAERRDLLDAFQAKISTWHAPVLFHHWLADKPIVETMGLHLPDRYLVDTMARAFQLGNVPQGLKAIARRLLGMEMSTFHEVVAPHSKERVLDYYRLAQHYKWAKPEPQIVLDEKTRLYKVYQPHSLNTKLKVFFTYYGKNADKDVFDAWENWESDHATVEAELGEWPGLCISHVPFDEVLHYACRDADATLRFWYLLLDAYRRVRKFSQEHWMEVA